MDERVDVTGSPGGAGGVEVVPVREWVEVLAVLLVGASVALVAHSVLTAWTLYDQLGIGVGPDRWDLVLPVAAQGGSLLNALVVAVSLGLVLVAPGPAGSWGRVALTGVSVVGVVVAALALLGVVEAVRPDQAGEQMWFSGTGGSGGSVTLLARVAEALRWIPGLVVAGPAAWMAWRNLNDGPAAPTPEVPGPPPFGHPEIDLGLDR